MSTATETQEPDAEEMIRRYKDAVERTLPRLAVKNGMLDIDSVWVETSIPYDILQEILTREDLVLPENVQRINTQSRVGRGEHRGRSRRSRRRKKNKIRH